MFTLESYVGRWDVLAERIDRSHALARWGLADPDLAGLSAAAQLVRLTRRGCDAARADRILGALARRAAGPHGDDDALLLLVHLLGDMVAALATDLADLSPDVGAIIVDELVCQIRSLDPDRPARAWGLGLKWATRRAVLAEFRPGRRRDHPDAGERPVDAGDIACWSRPHLGGVPSAPVPGVEEDLDVGEVLRWAIDGGVAAEDVSLLTATHVARAVGRRGADVSVAARFEISIATLYRRNRRTLAALRRCGAEYLAAVA